MQSHIGCIWIIFSRVSLQMCPQSSFPKIKTFIWFFSWMISQLLPQIVCINQQIVALVAFVWFFSRVSIEMPNQIACMNICKFSLVASARFFQSEFSHVLSICLHWQRHSELVALASFFFSITDYFSTYWAVLDSQSRGERILFCGPNMNTNIIRNQNFDRIRIRITFVFSEWANTNMNNIRAQIFGRIRIRIIFGFRIVPEYEYE